MSQNIEDLKNKIIYRASYRGTKEMDMLMTSFVKYILLDINHSKLKVLDEFINMNDEVLISIRKKESSMNYKNPLMREIIEMFQHFKF